MPCRYIICGVSWEVNQVIFKFCDLLCINNTIIVQGSKVPY
jgi:hypothetical protein